MARRRFIEGQKIDGRIVKEVFRNCACTEYLVTFTDGSYQIFYFKK